MERLHTEVELPMHSLEDDRAFSEVEENAIYYVAGYVLRKLNYRHLKSSDSRLKAIESSIRHKDRKLNWVAFGIDKSPSNTPRLDCLKNDLNHLVATFNSIEAAIEVYTIKDFHCLGKQSPIQSWPRPILAKFLRMIDVTTILSSRGTLKDPLFIKQDLSPEEKKLDSIQLNERWKLIQAGHNHRNIKTRKNSIFF